MSKTIAISLSPNTEKDDVLLAARLLFFPLGKKGDAAKTIAREELSLILNTPNLTLTSSGRSALFMALKASGVSRNDEVIIQAMTCVSVPQSVKLTGARPVYADIGCRSYNLNIESVKKLINSRTKAIIVQHTFGLPGPIEDIVSLARQHNLIVIEDCAHSLGTTYKNKLLGNYGDISIYSFGRDKIISSVFGGAVVAHNDTVYKKLQTITKELKKPPFLWTTQQLLHPILFSFIVPLYFTAALGKIALVFMQKIKLLSLAVEKKEKRARKPSYLYYQFPPRLVPLLLNQLKKLNRFNNRRRSIVQYYYRSLSNNFSFPDIPDYSSPAWLRFPLLVENPERLLKQAKQEHILLGDWYNRPISPKTVDPNLFDYHSGDCSVAEKVAAHIINLPTCPTLSDQDIARVADFINKHAKPYARN